VGLDAMPTVIKAVLCAAFILLTSPVGAHALARGAYRSGVPLCDISVEDEYAQSKVLKRYRSQGARTADSAPQEPTHA